MLNIEIIYVDDEQRIYREKLMLNCGSTVADALRQSRLLAKKPQLASQAMGIFSKPCTKDTLLKPDDRLEIYRPLKLDPKERRRRKAKE